MFQLTIGQVIGFLKAAPDGMNTDVEFVPVKYEGTTILYVQPSSSVSVTDITVRLMGYRELIREDDENPSLGSTSNDFVYFLEPTGMPLGADLRKKVDHILQIMNQLPLYYGNCFNVPGTYFGLHMSMDSLLPKPNGTILHKVMEGGTVYGIHSDGKGGTYRAELCPEVAKLVDAVPGDWSMIVKYAKDCEGTTNGKVNMKFDDEFAMMQCYEAFKKIPAILKIKVYDNTGNIAFKHKVKKK
jgi:hypothetical protein